MGLGFISVILFVAQVFQMVSLVVERNIPAEKVIKILILYLPLIFQFTIPIAAVMGTLLAIGRLSDDSEIIAMRSCGISLIRVFIPAFLFGIIMTIFTLGFYEFVLPTTSEWYAEARIEIYEINPTAELSRSLSYNTIDGIKISVDSVDSNTNELVNVRINYLNENKLIFARRGLLFSKDYEKNAFPLILFNATMQPSNIKHPNVDNRFDEQFTIQQTIYIPDRPSDAMVPRGNQLWGLCEFWKNLKKREFDITLYNLRDYNNLKDYEVKIFKLKREYKKFLMTKKESSNAEEVKKFKDQELEKKIEIKKIEILIKKLQRIIDNRNSKSGQGALMYDEYIFHRKLAFGFSAFGFVLLGAPLGIFSKRAGKSLGLGVSILVIVAFFGMVFLGNFLMKKGIMSSFMGAWYPAIILFISGTFFIILRIKGSRFRDYIPRFITDFVDDRTAGRVNRAKFLINFVISNIIMGINYLLYEYAKTLPQHGLLYILQIALYVIIGLALVFVIFSNIFQTVKRFHDLGKSGWYCLLLLIPIYGLILFWNLFFQKGAEETNIYGTDPLENKKKKHSR